MELHTLGVDLGKAVFHAVGLNERGDVVMRKKFSRTQLLRFTANLKVDLIGMESCGGAHFLGRSLREQGHEVRLIPAQYVKPFVKTNKNDYIDAEAIAEAVGRPTMRFVPIKNDDQLDLQSLHRIRERWVMRRTAVVNQIRSLLLERGITLRKGRKFVDQELPRILEKLSCGFPAHCGCCWRNSTSNLANLPSESTKWIASSNKPLANTKAADACSPFPEWVQ
jgi:transposase